MKKEVNDFARKKVRLLVEKMDIKIVKLGKVLGNGKEEAKQQVYLRGKRFLEGNSDIKIEALVKISNFFNKPVEYFFPKNTESLTWLSSAEKQKVTPPKTFNEIKIQLEKLGFDEDSIANVLADLKKTGFSKHNK